MMDLLHYTVDPQCILTGLLVGAVKACVADPKAQHHRDDLLCEHFVLKHMCTHRGLHKNITLAFEMS